MHGFTIYFYAQIIGFELESRKQLTLSGDAEFMTKYFYGWPLFFNYICCCIFKLNNSFRISKYTFGYLCALAASDVIAYVVQDTQNLVWKLSYQILFKY